MLEPIVKIATLPTDSQRAFELFTDRIADWWPLASHSICARQGQTAVSTQFEPFEGGKVYETSPSGEKHIWGSVTAWQPGKHVGFSWHVGRAPGLATQVDVTFALSDTGGTLVTLTHSNWEVLGAYAPGEHASYSPGWDQVFHEGFEAFAKGALLA
ncbi:MAG: hypothetical protein Hens3KO_16390 [Henriciella sp.]